MSTASPLKTQQKISGRLTGNDVTQDRLDTRSYIDTARKYGKNASWTSCTTSCSAGPRNPGAGILPVTPAKPALLITMREWAECLPWKGSRPWLVRR